ncbi:MAG: CYTH domain-containing protein [Candidatus Thermoplasmatota archaeon]|nr:CYTH domain-containing protein [Candidatus Thermoplasmatota archaeon]
MAINTEIERRFLVDGRSNKPWRNSTEKFQIAQYYLDSKDIEFHDLAINYRGVSLVSISAEEFQILTKTDHWVSRVRIQNGSVIFTLKGKPHDVATTELEWVLPSMPNISGLEEHPCVEKTRYCVNAGNGLIWEVDEFEGVLAGLILAEIELEDINQKFDCPEWIGIELTGLKNWSNASLATTLLNAEELKKTLQQQ